MAKTCNLKCGKNAAVAHEEIWLGLNTLRSTQKTRPKPPSFINKYSGWTSFGGNQRTLEKRVFGSPTVYIYFAILKFGGEGAPNLGEGPSTVEGVHHIGFYVNDLEEACTTIEKANSTECPGSSKVNRKYKGPDGLMIDLRSRGWDEQIRARSTLYELVPAPPVSRPPQPAVAD